jgi:hypothetical protein
VTQWNFGPRPRIEAQPRGLEGLKPVSDDSPEWAAVVRASAANRRASIIRSGLGGYVPITHPGHPSKWTRSRRNALADADASLADTTKALRVATIAHSNRAS